MRFVFHPHAESHVESDEQIRRFLAGTDVADFWTGYQIMLVCDAAQQAAADGRPVDIAALDASCRAG